MRARMAVVLALTCLVVVACGDGDGRYARYQDKKGAIAKVEALVATIPQYPGAHRTMSQFFGASYKLTDSTYIEAEPYWSALYYDLSQSVTGATLQRYFRRVLHASRLELSFPPSRAGRAATASAASVAGRSSARTSRDHGHYELDVRLRAAAPSDQDGGRGLSERRRAATRRRPAPRVPARTALAVRPRCR